MPKIYIEIVGRSSGDKLRVGETSKDSHKARRSGAKGRELVYEWEASTNRRERLDQEKKAIKQLRDHCDGDTGNPVDW